MRKKQWKTAAISIGTLCILSALVFLVFRDHAQEIMENIRAVRVADLLLLLCVGVIYQIFESAICFILVHDQMPDFTFWQAITVTFLGVFGKVSTLSVGSIPIQSYYLYRCGLMAGSGVGVLTLEYVFHKCFVLVYTTIMLLIQGQWLDITSSDLSGYMAWGYMICALVIVALIMLCSWKRILQLALWMIRQFPATEKWEKRKQMWSANLEALYTESQRILHNRNRLLKVIILNGLKLFCLFSIPFLCLRMLKISVLSFWHVQLLAALMYLITNALPNVAGMGPTEFAFILIFSSYMEYAQATSALILYRIATFFFPFILSLFVFLNVQKDILTDNQQAGEADTL